MSVILGIGRKPEYWTYYQIARAVGQRAGRGKWKEDPHQSTGMDEGRKTQWWKKRAWLGKSRLESVGKFNMRGRPLMKATPIPEVIHQRAAAAVAAAWEAGCPVADWRPEGQHAIADVCLRRFGSAARRGVSTDDRAACIRDLARGMVKASGQDGSLIGPLMRDYEWLAEQVLASITADASSSDPKPADDIGLTSP